MSKFDLDKIQVRGLNFLSVFKAMQNPSLTLGERYKKLKNANPEALYPAEEFIEITNEIEDKLGQLHLRKIGENIAEELQTTLEERGIKTAEDFLKSFVDLYNYSVVGEEKGTWEILSLDPEKKKATLKKDTPFNCILEEGILKRGLKFFTNDIVVVKQVTCVRTGDDYCTYEVTW